MEKANNEMVDSLFITIEDAFQERRHVSLGDIAQPDEELLKEILLIEPPSSINDYYVTDSAIFNLFRTIKIDRQFDSKSIQLLSYPDFRPDVLMVEGFTNYLYDLLKGRTVGQGVFNEYDRSSYKKGEWHGKMWVDYSSTSVLQLMLEKNVLSFWLTTRG